MASMISRPGSPRIVRITFVVALLFGNTACIAVDYPSKRRAQDAQAARALRSVAALENSYRARTGRYTERFADLGRPLQDIPGQRGCAAGYCYELALTANGFEARAWPETLGESGYRSFYVDQSGVVRYTVKSARASSHDHVLE